MSPTPRLALLRRPPAALVATVLLALVASIPAAVAGSTPARADAPSALTVTKTWDRARVGSFGTATATLTVHNAGTTVQTTELVDYYPPSLGFTAATDASGTPSTSCTAQPGEAMSTVRCPVTVPAGGDAAVQLTFSASYHGPDVYTQSTPVESQVDVQRAETYAALPARSTRSFSASCPGGYGVVDTSFRVIHVDDGTGTYADVSIVSSSLTAGGWTVGIRNDATGQAQGRVLVTCLKQTTSTGAAVTLGPVHSASADLPATGGSLLPLTPGCAEHQVPVAVTVAGVPVLGRSSTTGQDADLRVAAAQATTATLQWRCLDTAVGASRLDLRTTQTTASAGPGSEHEEQLTCPSATRELTAGWSGAGVNGVESRGQSAAFFLTNPGSTARTTALSLLCVGDRLVTGGTRRIDVDAAACNTAAAVASGRLVAPPAEACLRVSATAQPEPPRITRAVGTGVDRQVAIDVAVGHLRGTAPGYVEVTAPDGVYRRPTDGDQAITGWTFAAGPNGVPVRVSVRVCNADGGCTDPVLAPAAVPYGPVGAVEVRPVGTTSTTISYQVYVEPNGKPVDVTLDGSRAIGTTGVTSWTSPVLTDTVACYTEVTHQASVTDGTRTKASAAVTTRSQACAPDAPVVQSATATGVDRQGSLSVKAGRLNGSTPAYVEVLDRAGTSLARADVAEGGTASGIVVTGGTNGVAFVPQARVCNAQQYCSTPVDAPAYVPYGPIASVAFVNVSVNGPTVTYQVQVDPNGKAVDVKVNGTKIGTTGVGLWTSALQTTTLGYFTSGTFTAVASDGGRSKSASTTVTTPAGAPAAPTITSAVATGVNRQGKISAKAGVLNGGTPGTMQFLDSAGSVLATRNVAANGTVTDVPVVGGTNGVSMTSYARVCNAQSLCSPTVAGPAYTPYGPIGAMSVTILDTQLGPQFSYRVSVSPNGKPVTVSIAAPGGGATFTTGIGDWTSPDLVATPGYNATGTVTVTAADETRSKQVSKSAATEPPPTLTFRQAEKGSAGYCSSAYCHYLYISASNLRPNTRYEIYYNQSCATSGNRPVYANCPGHGTNTPGCGDIHDNVHYQCSVMTSNGQGNIPEFRGRLYGYPGSTLWASVSEFGQEWRSPTITATGSTSKQHRGGTMGR